MSDHVKKIVAEMPEEMVGKTPTPAANHPRRVSADRKEKADSFHKIVMQLQYLRQQGRPNIRTAVSFLCKRVSAPDKDGYKKLTRIMRYQQSTKNLKRKLESDGSGVIRWCVDASYTVHPVMTVTQEGPCQWVRFHIQCRYWTETGGAQLDRKRVDRST